MVTGANNPRGSNNLEIKENTDRLVGTPVGNSSCDTENAKMSF